MSTTRYTNHYGVHTEGRVTWLHQDDAGVNALGIPRASPFVVKPFRGRRCNHAIDVVNAVPPAPEHIPLLQQQGVRAFLPLPYRKIFYVSAAFSEVSDQLLLLQELSSPLSSIITPVWVPTPAVLWAELGVTNVQPLVLTNIKPENTKLLNKLHEARPQIPRTIILFGADDVIVPTSFERLPADEFTRPLPAAPWRELGAFELRKYMRHRTME